MSIQHENITIYLPVAAVWQRVFQTLLMMTSWNGNIFRVTSYLCQKITGHRWIPWQRTVTWSFDVFFALRLNERGCWFETPLRPLWSHSNVIWMFIQALHYMIHLFAAIYAQCHFYTLKMNTVIWHCKTNSDYFWTRWTLYGLILKCWILPFEIYFGKT